VVQDITDRKRAEAALRETTRTLEGLVHAAPVGIAVLDPEGKVLLWNPAMERIYGWTEEEVRGKPDPALAAEEEGARENLESLRAGRALDGVELRRTRKDGQPVNIRLWGAHVRDDGGRIKGIIGISLDVTRLKEMERIALVQDRMASLGQIAVGVAHEIRNPLSGINLYLHSLEKILDEAGERLPDIRGKTEPVIGSMQAASDKMESVIQRVLSFSRPGPPHMKPLDVNGCIREAVDMARISLQKEGARVTVASGNDLPGCLGDTGLIEQALLNLMTNAAQAMAGQEGERAIEVGSSRWRSNPGDREYVAISVADSGPGVPEKIRERIFDPFFTTKGAGTGIGLSITHKIITDHGGFIRVGKSRLGGALFTICLPAGDRKEISAA
jgi:PAS domain S-box-containing protein